MATTKSSTALNEVPEDLIQKRIEEWGDPNYRVIVSLFRAVPGASGGGTWPTIRANINCPISRVKDIAQQCSDLLVGGCRIKVRVEVPDETGQKHRVLPEWFETFDGTPRMGAHFDALTIAWDDQENTFVAVPRPGHTPVASAPYGASTYAAPPASQPSGAFGGAFADFPRPLRGPNGGLAPPPPTMIPGWMRNYAPEQQWDALATEYARANGGRRPSLEPVDVAMQWKDGLRQDVDRSEVRAARFEERLETGREAANQRIEAERNARIAAERRASEMETRHARELSEQLAKNREDALRAEIAGIKQLVANGPQQQAQSPGAGLMTALAPVLAAAIPALITANAASASRQTEMMLAIMNKPAPVVPSMLDQMTPLLAAVAPIAGPALLQWITSQSPAALAELADQRHAQGQAMVSMMMDFIKWQTPSDTPEPWWLGPLKQAVDGVTGGLNRAMMVAAANPQLPAQQQALPKAPPPTIDLTKPQRQQPGVDHASAGQGPARDESAPPPAIATPTEDLEMFIGRLADVDPVAANYTQLVMRMLAQRVQTGELDPRLITHEWVSIVFAVHKKEPLRELVPHIVDHLEHSRAFGRLPAQFAEVFTDQNAMSVFIGLLPISSLDSAYAMALTEALIEEIGGRERERMAVEKEDASGETEIEDEDDEKEEEEASA